MGEKKGGSVPVNPLISPMVEFGTGQKKGETYNRDRFSLGLGDSLEVGSLKAQKSPNPGDLESERKHQPFIIVSRYASPPRATTG